jgi:hypothetical protein
MVETPPTGRFDGRCVVPRKPPSASLLRLPKFTCFVVCLGLSDVSLVTLLDPIHLLLRVAPAPRVSNQDHPSHETYPSPVFAARDRSRRDRRRHLPLWRAPKSGGRARRASYHLEGIWGHQALALRSRGMQASAVVGTQHVARTCKTVLEGVNPHRRFGAPAIGISVVDAPRRSEQGRVT